MISERTLIAGVIGLVVATMLTSGPLVGAVDLTKASDFDAASVGTGSVDVGDVTLPDRGELVAGRFGTETFYLRVPDASVDVQRVIGQPIVTYRLSIRELGFARESVHFVDEQQQGTLRLSMGETEIDSEDVGGDAYTGELTVTVRSDGTSRVVTNASIPIEVVR